MSSMRRPLQGKYSPTRVAGWLLCVLCVALTVRAPVQAQEVEDQVAEIVSEATEERIEQAMEDLLDDIESRISEDSFAFKQITGL